MVVSAMLPPLDRKRQVRALDRQQHLPSQCTDHDHKHSLAAPTMIMIIHLLLATLQDGEGAMRAAWKHGSSRGATTPQRCSESEAEARSSPSLWGHDGVMYAVGVMVMHDIITR